MAYIDLADNDDFKSYVKSLKETREIKVSLLINETDFGKIRELQGDVKTYDLIINKIVSDVLNDAAKTREATDEESHNFNENEDEGYEDPPPE